MPRADNDTFSARQEQVVLLASKGLADKQIAIELGVSIATIHTYWSRLRKKFDGGNRAELVTLALHRNATETLTAKESENLQLIGEVVKRAEAERELADSQSRLQAIIDNTPVAVFVKDRYGRYTLINQVFQELVGRERDSIIGSRDHDLFGAEFGNTYQEQDQAVLESREPMEVPLFFKSPEGDKHFLTVKFPLVDSDDNVYAVGGFARDITLKAEFERQLQASEHRHRTLIENSTDAIALLDQKGTVLYASPSTRVLLGVEPQELVGTNAFRYIDREDLPRIIRDFRKLSEAPNQTIESSYWLTDLNGGHVFVEGRGTSFADDAGVIQVLLNYRDITHRELSRRRLTAKSAVAKALAEAALLSEAFPLILRNLCEALSFDYAGLWLVSEGTLRCECTYHVDNPDVADFAALSKKMNTPNESIFPCNVWKDKKAHWEVNFKGKEYNRAPAAAKARLKTAAALPIVGDNQILGVIEMFGVRSAPVDDDFLDGLVVIGQQIGQYIKRKEAESEELRLAKELADVLSDLKNTNEALERRVKIRTIELEEVNERLQEEIKERKRSEEDLLNMFHFAQGVVLCSPDGVMGFDRKCNITAWNKSMEALTGTSRASVLGQNIFDLFPTLADAEEAAAFRKTLKGESSISRGLLHWIGSGDSAELFDVFYEPVRNDAEEVIGGIMMVRAHQSIANVECL
jgi:PAS domain S-box-containing protein